MRRREKLRPSSVPLEKVQKRRKKKRKEKKEGGKEGARGGVYVAAVLISLPRSRAETHSYFLISLLMRARIRATRVDIAPRPLLPCLI